MNKPTLFHKTTSAFIGITQRAKTLCTYYLVGKKVITSLSDAPKRKGIPSGQLYWRSIPFRFGSIDQQMELAS